MKKAFFCGLLALPLMAQAAPENQPECRQLDASLPWQAGVREFLQSSIDKHSACTGTAKKGERKVAIFDWDDTIVKNGVGYVTAYYMLRNNLVLQPPEQNWKKLHPYLTDEAAAALKSACGTSVPAGKPLPTKDNMACADEIVSIFSSKTIAGKAAFAEYHHRQMQPAYLWNGSLLSGYSKEQIMDFARAVQKENLANPHGATQTVGSKQLNAWNRYYPQMKDLIATLHAHGIEAWIISASPEPIVQVWSKEVGISPQRTIGMRNLFDTNGKQTPHLAGCGNISDGEDRLIPYIEGKRCWANQAIFGIGGIAALQPQPNMQIIAGGDSVTDVSFLQDATEAALVINRNNAELMCHALDGLYTKGGKWAVQPMFINPLPQRAQPYACANAFTEADGSKQPVRRPDSAAISDQIETP